MSSDQALGQDLDLDASDAEGVKGGGIIDANATVAGQSATVSDANVTANALGASATTNTRGSSWGVNAGAAGQGASAGGRKPKIKRRRKR